ncbi:glycoside hydrolase family 5 protein [Streptomyces torulosus]|uniref:glycoside hydrolase family 5 protein n=1 Tax=Streptomyces torulosus TaxID=68276 RepID=UPI0006EB4C32|nr:cellulase family glycosylhydrolase [Streptomyces torulosus]
MPTSRVPLPRWRGFNLHQMFSTSSRWGEMMPMDDHRISEDDFRWIRDWGFDYVRVPFSYLFFIADAERRTYPEERLAILDRVVELGRTYDVHVQLNLWRAPGHTNFGYPYNEPEPGSLWVDDPFGSRDLFVHLWEVLAERYRGIPSTRLSFDLVNEPPAASLVPGLTDDHILAVYAAAIDAIRAKDPERLLLVEGLDWAYTPVSADWCATRGVAQSLHSFAPLALSHYRCEHAPEQLRAMDPVPTWPMDLPPVPAELPVPPEAQESAARMMRDRGIKGGPYGRDELAASLKPWFDVADAGVGVHAGETGAHNTVPHQVVLPWLDDMLGLLTDHGVGWALWNLRGPFGVLDSGRGDVAYDDWHGHLLDREMLRVLQKH